MRFTYLMAPPGTGRWWHDQAIVHALRTLNQPVSAVRSADAVDVRHGDYLVVRTEAYGALRAAERAIEGGAKILGWLSGYDVEQPWDHLLTYGLTAVETGLDKLYRRWRDRGVPVVTLRRGADFTAFASRPSDGSHLYDVAYAGDNTLDKKRLRGWVEPVLRAHRYRVSGAGWDKRGMDVSRIEANREREIYLSATVGLNVHDRGATEPNQRYYQIAACGRAQVCDRVPGVARIRAVVPVDTAHEMRFETERLVRDKAHATRLGRQAEEQAREEHKMTDIVRAFLQGLR